MLKLAGSVFGISALLAGVFVFWIGRFDLSAKPAKPEPEAPRVAMASVGPQSIALAANAAGQFIADIRINGLFLKGLVDTGATIIALPGSEARKLGLNPPQDAYTVPIRTANGTVKAARAMLKEVRVGPVAVTNVEAVIIPSGLDTILIGMSFLKRLSSFEMQGRSLVLRQ